MCLHLNVREETWKAHHFSTNSSTSCCLDTSSWCSVYCAQTEGCKGEDNTNSPSCVGLGNGCPVGHQSFCRWCSSQSKWAHHWVHPNLQELRQTEEKVRLTKKPRYLARFSLLKAKLCQVHEDQISKHSLHQTVREETWRYSSFLTQHTG